MKQAIRSLWIFFQVKGDESARDGLSPKGVLWEKKFPKTPLEISRN